MKVQVFNAALEKGDKSLGWTIARVPFEPAKAWPKMVRLRVKGEVNGFAFRTSLFPNEGGGGGYFLLVNKAMQQGGGARQMAPQFLQQQTSGPEKHTRIPVKISGLHVTFGLGQVGLLFEAANRQGLGGAGGRPTRKIDIAVAGFGPARLDAHHHQASA